MSSIVILGSLILAGLALYWLNAELALRSKNVAEARKLISNRSATLSVLAELKAQVPEANFYAEKLDSYLPSRDQLFDFRGWLESFGRFYNVSTRFDFQGKEVEPQDVQPGFAAFTLTLEGQYDDILDFVEQLERNPQKFLVGFGGFDIIRIEGNKYRVQAGGKVFFR